MLWIWFRPVSTIWFLKIAVPKMQTKSLKSTCEVVSFYCNCKLYTWSLLRAIFSLAFLKHFAKITCDFFSHESVENATSTSYKLVFFLVSNSKKSHHSHLKSIMHSFPRCTFMIHFDLEKTKIACCILVAKGWGWDLGQNLSNW